MMHDLVVAKKPALCSVPQSGTSLVVTSNATRDEMRIHRAYKTELDPNDVQRSALLRAAGVARFIYNWGLAQKTTIWEANKSLSPEARQRLPTAVELQAQISRLKQLPADQGGLPWLYETSSFVPQRALWDLEDAFQHFFRRMKESPERNGYPAFRRKKAGCGKFRVAGPSIRPTKCGRALHIPRIGKVRLKEIGYLPSPRNPNVKILSATISERAGRWFVSLNVEEEIDDPQEFLTDHVIGVDLGINRLATTSDDQHAENPRALEKAQAKLRRLNKAVARKKKGSNNRRKAVERLRRLHYRIACARNDAIHKATSAITKCCATVVVESLNVQGMMKNRRLARAIGDAGFGEFLRQIKYKAAWRGVRVVEAPRFYPSSKTCSRCGVVKEKLGLGDRTFRCEACGVAIDRDLNAALNLKKLAGVTGLSVGLDGSKACRPRNWEPTCGA